MAEPLKNLYNEAFYNQFLEAVFLVKPDFDVASFNSQIFDAEWKNRELKERTRHTTLVLKNHLSGDFKSNVDFILELIPALLKVGFPSDGLNLLSCLILSRFMGWRIMTPPFTLLSISLNS